MDLAAVNIPQFLHFKDYIYSEAFCKNSVLNRWLNLIWEYTI